MPNSSRNPLHPYHPTLVAKPSTHGQPWMRWHVKPSRTKPRAASDTIIFAVEEPELFLHPQALPVCAGQ